MLSTIPSPVEKISWMTKCAGDDYTDGVTSVQIAQGDSMRRILISVPITFLLVSGLGAAAGRQNIFAATPAYGAGICAVSSAVYPTIASALTDPSCSTIQLKAQTYYEHGLVISRSLTIQGAGSFATVIDAQHIDRALAVPYSPLTGTAASPFSVTISNLRIQNGNAEAATIDRGNGGAVDAEGTTALTLQNDDFRNNTGPPASNYKSEADNG